MADLAMNSVVFTMQELREMLAKKEALIPPSNTPLPPQGRLKYPRWAQEKEKVGMSINFDLLRVSKHTAIHHLTSTHPGEIIAPDFYRMVAAIEESNAEFEAFYMNDWPGRPAKLLGYPVFYSADVRPGEMFGGMWSDMKDGLPQHFAAFVWLTSEEEKPQQTQAETWRDRPPML